MLHFLEKLTVINRLAKINLLLLMEMFLKIILCIFKNTYGKD